MMQYKWNVFGYYFYEGYANGKWPFKEDYSRDCSLYDGWWGVFPDDHNPR